MSASCCTTPRPAAAPERDGSCGPYGRAVGVAAFAANLGVAALLYAYR